MILSKLFNFFKSTPSIVQIVEDIKIPYITSDITKEEFRQLINTLNVTTEEIEIDFSNNKIEIHFIEQYIDMEEDDYVLVIEWDHDAPLADVYNEILDNIQYIHSLN